MHNSTLIDLAMLDRVNRLDQSFFNISESDSALLEKLTDRDRYLIKLGVRCRQRRAALEEYLTKLQSVSDIREPTRPSGIAGTRA